MEIKVELYICLNSRQLLCRIVFVLDNYKRSSTLGSLIWFMEFEIFKTSVQQPTHGLCNVLIKESTCYIQQVGSFDCVCKIVPVAQNG